MKYNYADLDEFIEDMNEHRDCIFEWKGVQYFIDYALKMKGQRGYWTHRSISVFDPVKRRPVEGTASLYNLKDINDMLDNHYIDGERLRDIIMDTKCLEIH